MQHNDQKVVLFPKWKKDLESEAYQALREKRFHEALDGFNTLLSYQINNQEISVGKLTCLMELGMQEEAEELCESLLANKDANYFSYIHIYATLLFQASKYQEVSELLEDVIHEKLPDPFRTQLETLYHLNERLREEQQEKQAMSTLKELEDAVERDDTVLQWHLVNHLHQSDLSAYLNLFEEILLNKIVHPVIKTSILGLLQAESIDQDINIEKFSKVMVINPSTYPFIMDHPFRNDIRKSLEKLEQDNPTLFELADQLLYRYLYVRYPFIVDKSEADMMKKALVHLVTSSFIDEPKVAETMKDEEIGQYIDEILYCEKIYFSIMEE
ncbi:MULTISPECIES: hypothetical protein [Paraliobacillus]|uniref:hypothetical protein n=1 Tax=Paraliobacillus TaxID=200903 RepID=UPI000DD2C467|nr:MULTISPECIES: hypothetical protein [Paraliobacillus]